MDTPWETKAPRVDERRFYAVILAAVVLLAAATAVVILQGSHPRLRVSLELAGAPGSVSSRPRITLRFARPVAPGSVESRLRLSPEVPFGVTWRSAGGGDRELQLVLSQALQPGASYTLRLAEGVTGTDGQALAGAAEWTVTTRPLRLVFLALPPGEDGGVTLRVAGLDGGEPQQLSSPGQQVQDFGVAPDGSQVIYSVGEGPDTVNFWLVRPEVRGWDRVTDDQGVVYSAPRWSPAGDVFAHEERQAIAIAGETRLSNPKISLMRPDGSPAGLIYGAESEVGHTPTWSPDGTRLAFYDALAQAIGIFNFTDAVRRFPANSGGVGSWSPDGRYLVTATIRQAGEDVSQFLSVRDLEMGTEQFIEEPVGQMSEPAWSPDGQWIAYAYQPPFGLERGAEIVLSTPDGGERIALVHSREALFSNPVWSPAGDMLAFTQLNLADAAALPEVWVVARDGTGMRRVAEGAYLPQWLP